MIRMSEEVNDGVRDIVLERMFDRNAIVDSNALEDLQARSKEKHVLWTREPIPADEANFSDILASPVSTLSLLY